LADFRNACFSFSAISFSTAATNKIYEMEIKIHGAHDGWTPWLCLGVGGAKQLLFGTIAP
jgi:hypothetical protein